GSEASELDNHQQSCCGYRGFCGPPSMGACSESEVRKVNSPAGPAAAAADRAPWRAIWLVTANNAWRGGPEGPRHGLAKARAFLNSHSFPGFLKPPSSFLEKIADKWAAISHRSPRDVGRRIGVVEATRARCCRAFRGPAGAFCFCEPRLSITG